MVIGITGKYCAGKDTAVQFFRKKGYTEINVDRIGHVTLEKKKREITRTFGNLILKENGNIDRRKLGNIVFSDKKSMEKLESIVHPEMVEYVKEEIAKKEGNAAINAAILFKMGLDRLCDAVICIRAPFITRFFRALKRDSLSVYTALQRLVNQKKICPKSKQKDVDIYYIRNHKSGTELNMQLTGILDKFS
jgi:dephospho-CoA kinase